MAARRGIGAVAIAAVLGTAACSGGSPSSEPAAHETRTTVAATIGTIPPQDRSQAELTAIEQFREGLDALSGQPAVEVTFRSRGVAGVSSTGTAMVDLAERAMTSTEDVLTASGEVLVSERIVIDQTMYARMAAESEDESAIPWAAVDLAGTAGDFVDGAFTYFGAVGDTLDRVLLELTAISFDVAPPESSPPADMAAHLDDWSGVRIVLEAADIARFLDTSGLERIGIVDVSGRTVFEFWYDGDGTLRSVHATGTHFYDGEALEDIEVWLGYRIVDRPAIEPPTP